MNVKLVMLHFLLWQNASGYFSSLNCQWWAQKVNGWIWFHICIILSGLLPSFHSPGSFQLSWCHTPISFPALSHSYPKKGTFLGLIYGTTGIRAVNTDGPSPVLIIFSPRGCPDNFPFTNIVSIKWPRRNLGYSVKTVLLFCGR